MKRQVPHSSTDSSLGNAKKILEIDVEADGEYSFELRRWPEEEDRGLTAGIPGELRGWYSGGRAIAIKRASIIVGRFEDSIAVDGQDKAVRFVTALEKGPTRLQTWLEDEEGHVLGAYYVYIQKIS